MPKYYLIKDNSSCSEKIGELKLYPKDEATNFNADIANNFKSFKYKVNFLGNTEADGANGVLKMQKLLFH